MLWHLLCFSETIKCVRANKLCLLVLKGCDLYPEVKKRLTGTIDVWWIYHILFPHIYYIIYLWRGESFRACVAMQNWFDWCLMGYQRILNWEKTGPFKRQTAGRGVLSGIRSDGKHEWTELTATVLARRPCVLVQRMPANLSAMRFPALQRFIHFWLCERM